MKPTNAMIMLSFWLVLVLGACAVLGHRFADPAPLIDNSVGVWFLRDDPNLASYEQNNASFGHKEWSLVMLETPSVADPAFLRDLARLTKDMEALPHVRRVVSLANLRALVKLPFKEPAQVPLFDPGSPHPADTLRAGLARSPDVERLLLPRGWGNKTALLVQSDNFLHDLDPYRLALIDSIHRLVAGMPTVRDHALAGTTVINAELNRAARHDALRFYVLVTVMVLLFGWIGLRDIRDLAVVAAVLLVAVICPMGALAYLDIPFNLVTILLPLLLVSLSVCDVIHVINGFHGERILLPADAAARATIKRLWTPCLWTTIVTVAGILSLAFSSVAPIRQMGIFTSLGLVLAWACSMTMAPCLLAIFWRDRSHQAGSGWTPGTYGVRLLPWLSGRWRWIWLALTVVLMVPIAGLPRLRVDTDYTRFFSADAPVSQAYQKLKDAGMAQSVVDIVVATTGAPVMDSMAGRKGMHELESRVRLLPRVRHTISEAGVLRQLDDGLNGPSQLSRIPGYPDADVRHLRETARKAGISDLDDFATSDRSLLRITVLTDYMSSSELAGFRDAVARIARDVLPAGAVASVQGTPVLWANMDSEIGNTQVRSILVIAAVFVLLLPMLFRSLRLGLLGIFINGLPLAITFGLMGLLDIPLNMATALIGGVSIGSTVDSTLFFINRFQSERDAGRSWHEAIAEAIRGVGDGIFITTAILTGGFLCMTVSSFLPTAHFGVFTCCTILTGAFMDLVIDPILLGFLVPAAERPR